MLAVPDYDWKSEIFLPKHFYSSPDLVQFYVVMDSIKNKYGLHHSQDQNCIIHFMNSALPDELPTLKEIEQKFSGSMMGHVKTAQWNEKYMIKQDISLVMEGWTMLYLREMTSIPIPTVYAILTNKTANRDIIIMEYIPNKSLEVTWPTLENEDKEDIAKQLNGYFAELRKLPGPGFFGRSLPPKFGNLAKQPLTDVLFDDFGGPFDTIEQFVKGLGKSIEHNSAIPPERKTLYNRIIPRIIGESPPVFTHGDIQARNLIRKNSGQVVIVDWENSGWFPEWWESCATTWAAETMVRTDWPRYVPKFLSEFPQEFCLFFMLRTVWQGGW